MISAIILSSDKNAYNAEHKIALQKLVGALTASRVLDVAIVSRDEDKNIGIVELAPILKGVGYGRTKRTAWRYGLHARPEIVQSGSVR